MNTKVCLFIILFLTAMCSPNAFSENYTVIYSVQKDASPVSLKGYVIKNNVLYVCLEEEDKEKRTKNELFTKTVVYKIENLKMSPATDLTPEQAEEYISKNKNKVINKLWREEFEPQLEPKDLAGKQLVLQHGAVIELDGVSDGSDTAVTFVNKKTNVKMKDLFLFAYMTTYVYAENNKLYFEGRRNEVRKRGLFSYDADTGEAAEIIDSYYDERAFSKDGNLWPSSTDYENPVRIPATPYLLFCIDKSVNNGLYDEYKNLKHHSWKHFDIKHYFEVGVIEIPEWK